jgi:hypothetical protein
MMVWNVCLFSVTNNTSILELCIKRRCGIKRVFIIPFSAVIWSSGPRRCSLPHSNEFESVGASTTILHFRVKQFFLAGFQANFWLYPLNIRKISIFGCKNRMQNFNFWFGYKGLHIKFINCLENNEKANRKQRKYEFLYQVCDFRVCNEIRMKKARLIASS